jgi:hypothetical protein
MASTARDTQPITDPVDAFVVSLDTRTGHRAATIRAQKGSRSRGC